MIRPGTTDGSSMAGPRTRPTVEAAVVPNAAPLARQPRGIASTFRALRHRNYRLYFFGQLISLTGSWMQTAALMWLAYALTHQNRWTAVIAAAQLLPTFLFGAWGGILADRWPKRSLILVTQTAFMVLAFLLAGVVLAGCRSPWPLLLITAGCGLVQAVDLPARLAFVTDLAGREDLINAVGLNSLIFNTARFLGPALAGPLLVGLGPGLCFLANGLSYLAVLWALSRMDVDGAVPAAGSDQAAPARGPGVLSGFIYLAGRPILAFLVLLAGSVAFCGWPFLTLLPALAEKTLRVNATGYSWLLSSTGVGALAAALVVATLVSLTRWRGFISAGVGVIATGLVGLALAENLAMAMGCCALVGFGLILFLATGQSVVQLSAGDHNRGQVMAVWAMILSGAVPLGNLCAGWVADRWEVQIALGLLGGACAASALGLLLVLRLVTRWRASQQASTP